MGDDKFPRNRILSKPDTWHDAMDSLRALYGLLEQLRVTRDKYTLVDGPTTIQQDETFIVKFYGEAYE